MLGSSRGSSLADELEHMDGGSPNSNNSPTARTRKERKAEERKEKAKQDLLDLAKIQTDAPMSGEFYSNY